MGYGNLGCYGHPIAKTPHIDWLAKQGELGLPAEPTVLPGVLKVADYTCGIFGKWHLGYEPKFNPIEHGWNEFFGTLGGNVHYFSHRELSELHVLYREVGRLLAALNKQGLADDTLVVFASDNGGFAGAAHMGRLRGAKGTTFEGGIRVPLIIRWPGKIPAGSECRQVSATFDLTRSFLELGGAKAPSEQLDGYDIIDNVVRRRDDFNRTLY